MQLFKLDIKRTIIVFIVTLIVLYGGKAASYSLQVRKPLDAFFLRQAEVLDYTVEQCKGGLCVNVELDDVEDIQSQYAQLWSGIVEATGRSPQSLGVVDRRNRELEDIFRNMRIHIEEALCKGSFYAMSQAIDEKAEEARLDRWSVGVDSDYVYVQLHKGENYLYEIIPRKQEPEQHSTASLYNLPVQAYRNAL